MRIGFFSDRYLPLTDGVTTSIETFRIELEALGHEVYIFAPKPTLRYKDRTDHIIRFPAVKGLFFEDYLTSFFFPPQVIKQIEKLHLDIIHFHTPGQIGLFGAYFALRHNIPLITTYHTDLYEYVKHYPRVLPGTIALSMLAPVITGGGMDEYRDTLSSIKPERNIDKWNQKIVERGITMIHNHCDVVITPSHKIEHQLKRWKTQAQIVTLPTGVDKITSKIQEIRSFRKRYNLASNDNIVLFVGRVGTEKNIDLLIRAFDYVATNDPTAKLLIVGYGDDIDRFKKQAATSSYFERIIFTGRIDHQKLGSIYSLASVFAFPSVTDTQGLVINEAAQAGLPLVVVDREITEVLRAGKNGFFAKNNPKDFGNKILEILSKNKDQIQRMSSQSIELASEFSASNQASKLLRLYQETIGRRDEVRLKTKT